MGRCKNKAGRMDGHRRDMSRRREKERFWKTGINKLINRGKIAQVYETTPQGERPEEKGRIERKTARRGGCVPCAGLLFCL